MTTVLEEPVVGQKRSLETRRKILEVATSAFSSEGYNGTSIREIALAIGIKHQVLTYHFGNKEKLWIAVVKNLYAELKKPGGPFSFDFDVDDPIEEFRRLVKQLILHALEHPELYRIEQMESFSKDDRMDFLEEQRMEFISFVLDRIERIQALGIGSHMPVDDYYFIFHGALQKRFIRPEMNKYISGRPLDEEIIDSHADSMVKLFTGMS